MRDLTRTRRKLVEEMASEKNRVQKVLEISKLAKGKLKKKVNQLVKALEGNVTDHHRFLLKQHLAHVDFLVKQIETFDDAIQKKLSPYEVKFKLKTGKPYQDVGENIVNERRSKKREQAMIRDLERRGYAVSKVTATI